MMAFQQLGQWNTTPMATIKLSRCHRQSYALKHSSCLHRSITVARQSDTVLGVTVTQTYGKQHEREETLLWKEPPRASTLRRLVTPLLIKNEICSLADELRSTKSLLLQGTDLHCLHRCP